MPIDQLKICVEKIRTFERLRRDAEQERTDAAIVCDQLDTLIDGRKRKIAELLDAAQQQSLLMPLDGETVLVSQSVNPFDREVTVRLQIFGDDGVLKHVY